MRFLVSRLSALGDVVCGLPVASALKAGHPGCEVVWVCDRRFAAIPQLCDSVDQVVELPRSVIGQRDAVRGLGAFDVAIDLQGLLKSAWPVACASARERVAYHWQREGSGLFAAPVIPDPSSFHVVDQYVDVARAVGGVADRAEFALHPRAEDIEAVRGKLRENVEVSRPIVAVNAGAGWSTKRWAPQSFAELANRLDEWGADVVFLGAPTDRAIFEEVRGHGATASVSLVGETSLPQLVALLSLASAHVGGDTGSTHIAAALRIPAIGLYTLTNPRRSGPYGQIHRAHDVREGPIEVEAVFTTVTEAIQEVGGG